MTEMVMMKKQCHKYMAKLLNKHVKILMISGKNLIMAEDAFMDSNVILECVTMKLRDALVGMLVPDAIATLNATTA